MSMCRVILCVVGRWCLLWPMHSLGKTLLAFALLHFVLQGQTCLLLQVSLAQDGRVKIFSKIATCCWTTINRRILDPTGGKKRYLIFKANEMPQQDSRKGNITFRIKPHTHQRYLEGSNKTLCAPGPRDSNRDWARPAFEFLSVSCGGTDQQWPVAGTRALVAVDLGHTEYDISILGGGCC